MAFEGWVCVGGVEVVNSARAAQYAAMYGVSARATGCDDLADSLSDAPYFDQVTDPAPWYDPAVPDSRGFCGFIGLDIVGAADSTSSTRWTNLIGDGAVSGPLRRDARELHVKTVAIGADEAALSYGIAWLASVLRGSACRVGEELMLYAACPAPLKEPCLSTTVPSYISAVVRGDQLLRRLFKVMLLQGPSVTKKQVLGGGRRAITGIGGQPSTSSAVLSEVDFIVKAGVPFWYHQPLPVAGADGGIPRPPTQFHSNIVTNYDPDAHWQECLDRQDKADQSCLEDTVRPLPGCKDMSPPVPPSPPADPCYPSGPYTRAFRTVYKIERAVMTDWLEKVPIITLSTGATPLRRLIMRWYTNPQGRPPDDAGGLDPCSICSSFTIAYLPARSTLTIDGRISQAVVECVGNRIASPVLYGPRSALYGWPVFECNTSMLLEVLVDGSTPWAGNSSLDVFLCARGDSC